MTNHLRKETSPYLLQHADNPVNWYPWGEEALQLAKEQNKPILLSIGYAACHWCHVMAHESFEDETTAALMNEHFVNVKVDREERPDLDSIYMYAVTAMTGHGGWPMTVFLTPEGRPFYSGTYFPIEPRYGMPSFKQVLLGVADAWRNQQDQLQQSAEQVTHQIQQSSKIASQSKTLSPGMLTNALANLAKQFDQTWGGFGQAPKFPQPMVIEFLLREHLRVGNTHALEMAELTLQKMAQGGMYDHLGGGFARYAVDGEWLVPHFEKMLYDNAQLARVYLHAWQVTAKPFYRRITEKTLDYVLREMRHTDAGFFSSQDADSEGVEGKFYVWSADEIRNVLGDDAALFMRVYGVTDGGNWEGHNILHQRGQLPDIAAQFDLTTTEFETKLASAGQKLYEVRAQRIWPGLDDKVLTAWNGLMLAAFAEAGQILNRADYVAAATRNAEFLYRAMRTDDGRLYRTWKAGSEAKYNGYLEDYAYLAEGLLVLYQATFDTRWFRWAHELAESMLAHFRDMENSGFFDTPDDHEPLIHRPKDVQDNAVPSGNAMAAHVLFKLSLFTGQTTKWDVAEQATSSMGDMMAQYPTGFGEWLNVASFSLGEPREIALIGSDEQLQPLLRVVRDAYRPYQVVAAGPETEEESIALLAHRPQVDSLATAYVCRRFVCQAPVTDTKALAVELDKTKSYENVSP
ncbi:MAG: thioredoxin domain-containing protein [Acidiferrobacterales bacterium]